MELSGWIVYNGSLPGTKFIDFAQMFQEAASRKNMTTTLYRNDELIANIHAQELGIYRIGQRSLPDYVIFTDKDIYLARQLELLGVRVFNRSQSIQISDDKISTYQVLADQQLPIPKTMVAPKVFSQQINHSPQYLNLVAQTLGFPLIVKEAFGSFGEQVHLIHTAKELREIVNQLHGRPYMFQQFISTSYGKDLRLHVVGDEVVAAMKRTSKNDFRSNITTGGTMEAYKPNTIEKELAIAGTKAIGADFAGVDLLFGKDGPIICEINSNAHIRNMYDCTNINVADFIIDYIIDTLHAEKA
ncbi:MAG TPA: RimK family alpha-L-glutamate ligase [Bacillota bacterium]|nr:RimK family alpha-L-glutamate ligase [Bacillota bacterium]